MPVVAVFNQKGGVGKTTTTLNVGAALLRQGMHPVLLDLDPQAHLTLVLGLRNVPADTSLYAFFEHERPLRGLIQTLPGGAQLVPASADLSKIEAGHAADLAMPHRLKQGLVTRFDSRRRLSYDIYAMLVERFGDQVCETAIAETVALAESPMHGKDIFSYAGSSQGAADYRALTDELRAGNFFT